MRISIRLFIQLILIFYDLTTALKVLSKYLPDTQVVITGIDKEAVVDSILADTLNNLAACFEAEGSTPTARYCQKSKRLIKYKS